MSEPELIRNDNMPARAPDLIAARDRGDVWRIDHLSGRLAIWMGLGNLDVAGQGLTEVFRDVSPSLDYLADEALAHGHITSLPVQFLGMKALELLADVTTGGHDRQFRQRQVHFYFRPAPTGQARTHRPHEQFGLVGNSPGMQEVYRKINLYAESDAPVIITGETGTGKELVARALHEQGPRQAHSFVAVNCSAISPELLESELFGHEKGAFTGAVRSHRGRFERAHQGTIFLDEIGDMPGHAQVKLLRILEDGCLERVGSEKVQPVDVRVVGATNVPLEQAVSQGRFRQDLYHRLAVLRIHLPALRQRPDDIPLLVSHFLALFSRKYRRPVERVTSEAMSLLQAYLWPGNVRELRNVLERVFIESQANIISARAFKEWIYERQNFSPGDWGPQSLADSAKISPPYPLSSERILLPDHSPLALSGSSTDVFHVNRHSTRPARLTEDAIRRAYEQASGNLTTAARLLGVHRATLYRYLKKLKLTRDDLEQ
ncbi:MAG: sigma-54-dependent Fis family transcriptional regulator [Deltaproteobacteria bacterium]|nr:sigma-54-dependent Fis family transcriptional regulator [Deltaproteobacteria bacterium]